MLSNAVCPLAASRMTETVMPKDLLQQMQPEAVVPLALALCHEGSSINGEVIEAGGGWFAKIRINRAKGAYLDGKISPEQIQESWDKITDFSSDSVYPKIIGESVMALMAAAAEHKAKL